MSSIKTINILHKPEASVFVLDDRSVSLRRGVLNLLKAGMRGHLASALSLVEILRVLYDDILVYNPNNPKMLHRDRFILSKGHGCMALYVILAEKGFFPEEELQKFCKIDGILGGHPETIVPGIEASTGSLGHGLSIGIGFSLSAKYEGATHRIFVLVGDGELNEGSIWEGAMCAAKHNLNNLTLIVDNNKHQSYGPTSEVMELEPLLAKFRSFGFGAMEVDGHNVEALKNVFTTLPVDPEKPSAIICHTVKGKGIDFVENNLSWHHKSKLTEEQLEELFVGLERTG